MRSRIDEIKEIIGKKNPLQEKYLNKHLEMMLSGEYESLEKILSYFEKTGWTIEKQGEAYLAFLEMIAWETKFFIENGRYRYQSLEEVMSSVYENEEYMTSYMVALGISDYLWSNHLAITRWFESKIVLEKGKRYLEIGPGHGQYFAVALEKADFEEYLGIDLSKKSVEVTKKYINYIGVGKEKQWKAECRNFFDFSENEKFHCITMMEVLEHVEKPQEFLNKIYNQLTPGGKAYITTVVNAPAIDHIYLFNTVEEIQRLIVQAGFKEKECLCIPQNGYSLEKAKKKKAGINVAFELIRL